MYSRVGDDVCCVETRRRHRHRLLIINAYSGAYLKARQHQYRSGCDANSGERAGGWGGASQDCNQDVRGVGFLRLRMQLDFFFFFSVTPYIQRVVEIRVCTCVT